MAKRKRGVLVRFLEGRVDRSILSDVGVVTGLVLVGVGLAQLHAALGWIFAGAAVAGVSVVSVLPPKIRARSTPKGDA
jgi:hypothetical protein